MKEFPDSPWLHVLYANAYMQTNKSAEARKEYQEALRLKQDLPHVRCYSAQPSSGFHGLEGMKHMPTSIVPGIYDPSILDGNFWLETEDAHTMVRRMAREEGLLIGVSSGGNLHAAALLARELEARGESALIVTILCDAADKYLSEHFWDDSD